MKITIVLGAFFPVPPIMGGAIEKTWFALAQEFARRGHDVVQISRAIPQFPRTEIIDGVTHIRVGGFDSPASLLWLKALDLLYSSRVMRILPQADIIVTNTFWLPLLLRDSTRGAVYVHVARFPKGQMRFYQRAARLQTPSSSVARAIIDEVPSLAANVKVVPYPCPESSDRMEPPPVNTRPKTILYVGRVHPEKGVHLLIEAFGKLPPEIAAEWMLTIIGPTESRLGGGGESYRMQLQAAINRTKSRVVLRGSIFDSSALEAEFRRARIFVYPSLAEKGETFGLAPLEAMAQGCAVIVSRLGCFGDFITDGETGAVFDHRAASASDALAAQLQKFMDDESLAERIAQAGYRKAKDYSMTEIAGRFLADFESVVAGQPA